MHFLALRARNFMAFPTCSICMLPNCKWCDLLSLLCISDEYFEHIPEWMLPLLKGCFFTAICSIANLEPLSSSAFNLWYLGIQILSVHIIMNGLLCQITLQLFITEGRAFFLIALHAVLTAGGSSGASRKAETSENR